MRFGPISEAAVFRRIHEHNTELSAGVNVDIEGDLSLEVDGGKVLPTLRARIVPGQEEDLLISAGVMDAWQVTPEPKFFTCYGLGVQIPRMYPLDTVNALLRMVHAEIVEPGQEKTVKVQMVHATEEVEESGLMWVEPIARDLRQADLEVAEGPVNIEKGQDIWIRIANSSATETMEVAEGRVMGCVKKVEDVVGGQALTELMDLTTVEAERLMKPWMALTLKGEEEWGKPKGT